MLRCMAIAATKEWLSSGVRPSQPVGSTTTGKSRVAVSNDLLGFSCLFHQQLRVYTVYERCVEQPEKKHPLSFLAQCLRVAEHARGACPLCNSMFAALQRS